LTTDTRNGTWDHSVERMNGFARADGTMGPAMMFAYILACELIGG
jgi:hypothetical protein